MQTTFFFCCVFPPPAAGPEIFAGANGAGTWCATDTYKTAVVQNVIRNIIFVDVFFYLFSSSVKDGSVLDYLVGFVPLNNAEIIAIG
jgi:hypothetical protein